MLIPAQSTEVQVISALTFASGFQHTCRPIVHAPLSLRASFLFGCVSMVNPGFSSRSSRLNQLMTHEIRIIRELHQAISLKMKRGQSGARCLVAGFFYPIYDLMCCNKAFGTLTPQQSVPICPGLIRALLRFRWPGGCVLKETCESHSTKN